MRSAPTPRGAVDGDGKPPPCRQGTGGSAERLDVLDHALDRPGRRIAQTLQPAHLPERPPTVEVLQAGVRHTTGDAEVDVGGNWCDLVRAEPGRELVAVASEVP